jgi:hypothetical protein
MIQLKLRWYYFYSRVLSTYCVFLTQFRFGREWRQNPIRQFFQWHVNNTYTKHTTVILKCIHYFSLLDVAPGCVVLVALGFLMPVFYYIPKSVLAAVIIVAVVALIEVEEILPMWRGRSMF